MSSRLLVALTTAGLLAGAGCRHCCHSRLGRYDRGPAASRLDPPVRPSGIPPTDIPTLPPSSVPALPPPEVPDTSRSSFRLGDPLPPPDAPPAAIAPAPPRELLVPDGPAAPPVVPSAGPAPEPRRWLGEPVRPDDAPPADRTAQKPADVGPGQPPAGFVRVAGRDGQATGRVPDAAGLGWLAANGFRTVLVLHDPKAEPLELRAEAERRGLRLLTVAVDPADVATGYAAFARAVADRGGRPLYVADADPARASALWYALFRKDELAGDDVARLRAGGLGAAPDRAAVWPQVQDLLARP